MHLAALARTVGASVESRSQEMKDARRSLGGGAFPPSMCFRKQPLMNCDHCELGRHRVVSPLWTGKNTYGVSVAALSN